MDARRQQKAAITASQYRQGNIAGLDDAMTRRLVASTVFTESNGGDLAITNRQGYVGRYQAGAQWLADAGYVDRAKLEKAMDGYRSEWAWAQSGGMTRFLNEPSNWRDGLSLEKYKTSSELQDEAFKRNCGAAFRRALKENVLQEDDDPKRIAGFLKARHIAGYGGAKSMLLGAPARRDSNGTSNYDYFNDIARNRDGLDESMGMLASVRAGAVPAQPSNVSVARGPAPSGYPSVLEQGDHGARVERLQTMLDRLGYRGPSGRRIRLDGDFGPETRHAIEVFQREHGLSVDGIVGPDTRAALQKADEQLLSNPKHPRHGVYQQVLDAVHLAEVQRCVASGSHSERLAAALTVEAIREDITRVDRVELNDRGTLARAVQVNPLRDESGLNRTTDAISTLQAMQQSLRESSEQVQQVSVNRQVQQEDMQREQSPGRTAVL